MNHLREHVAIAHGGSVPEAETILEIHQAILGDDSFHEQVLKRIAADEKSAEWCLWQEASAVIAQFGAMRDPYFEARGEDIRDMAYNLIAVLSGETGHRLPRVRRERVVISRHLHSSDVFLAHGNHSGGFVSESRALLSHAAILLKGFGIASVAGVEGLTGIAHDGDEIVVDGTEGLAIVHPSARTVEEYRVRQRAAEAAPGISGVVRCTTADGVKIVLRANVENPQQVKLMLAQELDGIGLFRTEFLVSAEGHIPTEEEQYEAYRLVVERAVGRSVTIRTFDIGGDKSMGMITKCAGRNPALGLRGIRRHLVDRPAELRTQLRAILRASVDANVGILIPMVTTVEDIVATKRHIAAVREELREAGVAFSPRVLLGAMIETPAAAATVREILSEVDFVSVGSNDLLQYFMAADRDNERVLHYQDAASPAFLWLLDLIIRYARELRRETSVTVCGEISSDPHILPHLLRMGYRSFSISPASAGVFRAACAGFRQTPTARERQARIR